MAQIINDRPYVIISCAMSLDGCLDDSSDQRLLLSSPEDFDEVDELRANCDAIMIGANTIRRDNPRLIIKSAARRESRISRGLPETPHKVTMTRTSTFEPHLPFFETGDCDKFVYCPSSRVSSLKAALGGVAKVLGISENRPDNSLDLGEMLNDLRHKSIEKLLVEGGSSVISAFLEMRLVDELRLAIAPYVVGDNNAPRLTIPFTNGGFRLDGWEVSKMHNAGDTAVVHYVQSARN